MDCASDALAVVHSSSLILPRTEDHRALLRAQMRAADSAQQAAAELDRMKEWNWDSVTDCESLLRAAK